MKRTQRPPASAEVQLEPWLRTVRWLRDLGLEPVVPVDVAWQLHELYGLRVSAPVEVWARTRGGEADWYYRNPCHGCEGCWVLHVDDENPPPEIHVCPRRTGAS